ncbi:MAG: hypothetical protein IJ970_00140 [Mycoplasmataceae bacterium]|nr:hypothetical protein [Mycoplasmataceae bacterium]
MFKQKLLRISFIRWRRSFKKLLIKADIFKCLEAEVPIGVGTSTNFSV